MSQPAAASVLQFPAFKDWAVIVEALGRGRQALILRKGGIAEGNQGFTIAHRSFWLFPTLYHQQLARTKSDAADLITEIPEKSPDYAVPIRYRADITDAFYLEDWRRVDALEQYHVWCTDVIRERFDYGGEDGIHAFVCRVHALAEPRVFPWNSAFEGCKSWVDVPLPLDDASLGETLTPVLSDAQFEEVRNGIRGIVGA
ncbi:MAG: DUF1802 family protein [Candidatus Methylacidiphilales bacterium]|nr:DUF1802 family protein [Candidatus Methylacidiphilales bacterium]